jgi:PAS domain S-box-containing protein
MFGVFLAALEAVTTEPSPKKSFSDAGRESYRAIHQIKKLEAFTPDLKRVCQIAESQIDECFASVFFVDSHEMKLTRGVSPGLLDEVLSFFEEISVDFKKGPFAKSLSEGKASLFNHLPSSGLWNEYKSLYDVYGFSACAIFPVGPKKEEGVSSPIPLAVLVLLLKSPRIFKESVRLLGDSLSELTFSLMEKFQTQTQLNVFQKVFEKAHDSILITNAELNIPGPEILYVNPAFSTMTGYAADEVIHKTPRILQGEKTDPRVLRRVRENLELGECFLGETVNYRKDRSEFILEWYIEPIRNEQGEVTHYIAFQRDVTERVGAERERELLLKKEKSARIEAERANHAKDLFLATLSHELKTPLTTILTWAELMKEERLAPELFQKGVEMIEVAARSQVQLIKDLLDVSRIVAGKLSIDYQLIELEPLLQSVVESFSAQTEKKKLQVFLKIDTGLQRVLGDPDRIRQVIWNILSNAVKFTPQQGCVWVEAKNRDGAVQVKIRDTGIGIESEFLPSLFKKFSQAETGRTRSHSGMGLGLAISRDLIELMGGQIEALSAGLNQGALFILTFRGMESRSKKSAHQKALDLKSRRTSKKIQKHQMRNKKILLVDDDFLTLEALSKGLALLGAEVLCASSAKEGIEVLEQNRVDFLVSDLAMPKEDGYFFMRKTQEVFREKPFSHAIALSAFSDEDEKKRIRDSGFERYLEKPVNAFEVAEALIALDRVDS